MGNTPTTYQKHLIPGQRIVTIWIYKIKSIILTGASEECYINMSFLALASLKKYYFTQCMQWGEVRKIAFASNAARKY